MSKTNTILELEQLGRYSEAGYGRLFAYDSRHFNAMIDARSKAKYIRLMNPDTTKDTQENIVYSGPTVFHDSSVNIEGLQIDKIDLKSAYLSYLINEKINKPGIFRIKHEYVVPVSDRVTLYLVQFNCDSTNPFVKWFLNSSAIQKRKIKTNGVRIWGTVGIFASTWANNLEYVSMFLGRDEGQILKSYTFHGKDTVEVTKSQIDKLYRMKEHGNKNAKNMLVQSTGWLSIIDKPTYYHMVQYIKFYLLKTLYDYELQDDNVGVQTDCLFIRVTETSESKLQSLRNDNLSLAQKPSTIGTYTFERVNFDDIIANKARVVLK